LLRHPSYGDCELPYLQYNQSTHSCRKLVHGPVTARREFSWGATGNCKPGKCHPVTHSTVTCKQQVCQQTKRTHTGESRGARVNRESSDQPSSSLGSCNDAFTSSSRNETDHAKQSNITFSRYLYRRPSEMGDFQGTCNESLRTRFPVALPAIGNYRS
jgi:hypothetical protein